MLVVDKINNYINHYGSKDSNYSIAVYIQKNIEDIPFLNTTQLAEQSYVSQATVSRFIQKLGYITYGDFKDDIIRYLEDTSNFDGKDTGTLIYKEIFNLLDYKIDLNELSKVANLITEYKNVYAIGINYCYFMSEYFQTECHNFRKVINVLSESSSFIKLEDTDLLIVISTSGNYFSQDTLVKSSLKGSKAKKLLIGINSMDRSIERLFDYNYIMRSNVGNKNSHYLLMAIMDYLIEMIKKNKRIEGDI